MGGNSGFLPREQPRDPEAWRETLQLQNLDPSSASSFILGSIVSSSVLASASVSKDRGTCFIVDKLKPFTYCNLYLVLFLLKIKNGDINVFLEAGLV